MSIPGTTARALSTHHRDRAAARQRSLTKPPGSLGQLEDLAIRLAAMQHRDRPAVERIAIRVFAADHGIAGAGVSAYPQAVTAEMVRNFSRGGAAISVLARLLGADFGVVNAGTLEPLEPLPGVLDARIGAGTRDFCVAPAMSEAEFERAIELGIDTVAGFTPEPPDLFIGGEMGIGNTSAAAAVICALFGLDAARVAGPGTGLDEAGRQRKAALIDAALARHGVPAGQPATVLRTFGGFEIAALCGAYLACAERGIAVLVDGFVCTAAAAAAGRLAPGAADWFLFSHCSAEPGHRLVFDEIGTRPILDLGMRLGEASGAAVAAQVLRAACALHNEMATFEQAGVSEKSPPAS